MLPTPIPTITATLTVGTALAVAVSACSTGGAPRSVNTAPVATGTVASSSIAPAPGVSIGPGGIRINPGNGGTVSMTAGQVQNLQLDGQDRTADCADGTIDLTGSSNHLTITGHCAALNVTGNANDVTVDSADIINATGKSNNITYHQGQPIANTNGNGNVIHQG